MLATVAVGCSERITLVESAGCVALISSVAAAVHMLTHSHLVYINFVLCFMVLWLYLIWFNNGNVNKLS